MRVTTAAPDALIIDTTQKLTPRLLSELVRYRHENKPIAGVARYAPFSGQSTGVASCLDVAEVADTLAAGLPILPIQHVRYPGWKPSYEMGSGDGLAMVMWCRNAGLPIEDGLTLWYDLEGTAGSAQDCIAYDQGWTDVVARVGAIPGGYLGFDVPLDGAQRWALKITRYWRAAGNIIAPSVCGWCVRQLLPINVEVFPGLQVDFDAIAADELGRLPTWVAP